MSAPTVTPETAAAAAEAELASSEPSRSLVPARRFPTFGPGVVAGALLLLVALVAPPALGTFVSFVGARIAIIAMVGLSVTIVTGFTGQLSLMPWTFAGIGVFVGAHAMTSWGWPFWFAAVLAAALTVPVSALVGLVAARLQGFYFAIATLTFATAAGATLFSWDLFTGGQQGMRVVRPVVGPVSFEGDGAFYVLTFVTVMTMTWMVLGIQRSRAGRAMAAVRENEIEAQALGINVTKVKLNAFILSGIFAAVGGVFQGMLLQQVTRTPFQTPFVETLGVTLVIVVVVGGMRSAWGPFIGATVIYLQQEVFRSAVFLQFFVAALSATLFLYVLLRMPGGLVGLAQHEASRIKADPRKHLPRVIITLALQVGVFYAIVRWAS